jgi:hypothetical protein
MAKMVSVVSERQQIFNKNFQVSLKLFPPLDKYPLLIGRKQFGQQKFGQQKFGQQKFGRQKFGQQTFVQHTNVRQISDRH